MVGECTSSLGGNVTRRTCELARLQRESPQAVRERPLPERTRLGFPVNQAANDEMAASAAADADVAGEANRYCCGV